MAYLKLAEKFSRGRIFHVIILSRGNQEINQRNKELHNLHGLRFYVKICNFLYVLARYANFTTKKLLENPIVLLIQQNSFLGRQTLKDLR